MPFAAHPLNVAILAVPGVTAWTLFGMVDLFSTVGRDWSLLVSGIEGVLDSSLPSAIPPTVYARSGNIPAAILVAAGLIFVIRRVARRTS